MLVRKATPQDMPHVVRIAWRLALDYPGLENDSFFVAEERGKIVGILGLKDYGEFLELVAVGVLEEYREMGIGKKLVEEVLKDLSDKKVYLLTTVPGFYEKLGFEKVEEVPEALKKDPVWCAGCDKNRCVAMHRKASNNVNNA
ncbi:MAG: GNAT family N-acetyltransferase [Candidatus Saccharicenans sp.]|nr:GNAT family N-acetyltransferase [Candidatus Saccharicenans sp.]